MGSLRNGGERGQHEGREEETEPILVEKSQRFCMFPIRYSQLWEMYKKAEASFWTAEEVDLSLDVQHWDTLSDSEKHFISHVLAFFAASDGIVLENLAARFINDVQIPEARAFYGFQIAMENIHSEMYSLLLETYIRTQGRNIDYSMQLRIFLVLRKKPSGLWNGFKVANSMIIIYMRYRFWQVLIVLIFICSSTLFAERLWEKVHHIVHEAVEIETEFVCEALPCALIGMNSALMSQYIKFVADRLLVALGYQRKYNVENPFDWMEFISLQGKANFFERRVGDYQKSSVMSSIQDGAKNFVFKTDEDF
ncbi:ribonucleotide reductase 2A [Actinidia rufa]|uniref:Ribonucleotide reductase 2A n=1 Tax=Actinidia rufa TaxID=165716 RepID=A0A7J0HFK7_9ERIC|nr:ribonucleotide reductase 2A [Actinidia rufa]